MNKLVINKLENKTSLYLYEEDNLVEKYDEYDDKPRLEGNIYLGKVQDVVPGLQSAFIDIGEEKNALIHLKDLLPKISESTGNENLNINEYDIKKELKVNDMILVQIKRDCTDQKGPRVTKDIKLTGKYVIIMPFSKFITVSQKINDNKRKELIINNIKKYLPNGYGAIARTSSLTASEKDIENDIQTLLSLWNEIDTNSKQIKEDEKIPKKLYDNKGIIGKIILDMSPLGLEIETNSQKLKDEINKFYPNIPIEVKDIVNLEEDNRKIWLKCGGFITIDKTEALTAIDVNSGKFTGKKHLEDTVLKVNLEATEEIAKQIRLRDIGGIIIIDYIDMDEDEDKNIIIETMKNALKTDRSKVQVLEFTKLGLLEMTRKHMLGR